MSDRPLPSDDTKISRRHLLVLGSAASVAACSSDPPGAGPVCAATPDGGGEVPAEGPICVDEDHGITIPVSELTEGCVRIVKRRNPTVRAFLIRDARGIYAMTIICTHTGCELPLPQSRGDSYVIRCTCHFSEFSLNGVVAPGSTATRDLEHYRVRICDGMIYVNTREIVSADTRLAVTDVTPVADGGVDANG